MSVQWRARREELDPEFAADVESVLSADPASWIVVEGKRDTARQEALYRAYQEGGPLAAAPGHSAHECSPLGRAVDITLVVNGRDEWNYDNPNWRRLVETVKRHPRLHSLDSVGDTDHIEQYWWRRKQAEVERVNKNA